MSNTPNLSIPHIASNQNKKEVTANTAFDDLDTAMTDTLAVSIATPTASNVTPTASTVLLAFNIKATNAPSPDANVNVIMPANKHFYRIHHAGSGTHTVTFKVTGQTGVTLSPGQYALVFCNGTDVILADNYSDTAAVSHKWINSIVAGVPVLTQPDYSDLTGTPTLASSLALVSHQWLDSYDASTGLFTQSQPASTDLSDVASLQTVANLNSTYPGLVAAPSHFNSTGTAGSFAFDSSNVYFCVASNSWVQISSAGVFSTSF